ncbi:MAG: phosphatase PAP2 family protein [Desulfobacterales bacterium]|nr:phosphatase PAP2 family protein [Desulfobacterales bacterium]
MLFLDKDRCRINVPQAWAGFIVVLLLCGLSMIFVDRQVLLLVHQHLPAGWQQFFERVTRLGKGDIWISSSLCIAAGAYLLQRYGKDPGLRRRCAAISGKAFFVFLSIVFSGLLLNLVKTMIGRYRPRYFLADNLYGFQPFNFDFGMNGFPSGHSQTAWALMISLSLLFPRYTAAFVFFAALVSASRVFVSAHFVSDILMGSYMGMFLTLYLYTRLVKKGYLVPGQ